MDNLPQKHFFHHKPWSSYHSFLETKQVYIGLVNFGGEVIVDSAKITWEAIVFMFDRLTGKWKCSIGYYLIDGKSAAILLADAGSNCFDMFLNFKVLCHFFQDHRIDRDTYGAA